MRNIIGVAIALLTIVMDGFGQTPTYQFSNFSGISAPSGGSGGTELEYKQQCLYTSHDFPGMPIGWVKAIYCRVARGYTVVNPAGNCTLKKFTLKIGYTYDSVYRKGAQDSFRSGLTAIYGPDTFSVPCSQSVGGAWIRIPVIQNAFHFDHEHFFAVEIAWGPNDTGSSGFPPLAGTHIYQDGLSRSAYVYDRSITKPVPPMGIPFGPAKYDLGFDLGGPSTAITSFSNIQGIGLFPNPAPGGRFNISLDAKQPMKEVRVRITDVTGRVLHSRQFSNPGKSFFEEMNLSGAAPGMYFVRITADGETFSRRVSVAE